MPFLPAGSTGVIVNPGDFIELRYPTPDTWNTNITFQVQIGEGTDDVTVGTKLPDAQPDFFSFTDQFGRTNPTSGSFIAVFEKNTTYYSQAIQVSGIELRVPIRIAVLDCPENSTSEGKAATRFAKQFKGKQAICELTGKTTYDRKVGYCSIDDKPFEEIMVENTSCEYWCKYDVWNRFCNRFLHPN